MSNQSKNLLFVALLFIAMLSLLGWYLFAGPKPSLPITATSTPSANTSDSNSPKAEASPKHLTENAQYFDIDMQYPSTTSLAAPAQSNAAQQAMKTFAEETITSFKKDNSLSKITPADAKTQGLDQGRKYALTSDYKIQMGAHTVSYAFTIYEDTLGAHPNTYFRTFTFNNSSGQSLELADLFTTGSDYLARLSVLTRDSLIKQQGNTADQTSFINPGTTPDAANFANFVIDGSNLIILFSPYQVASYAQGPQSVKIPLTQLKPILKPEYQ